MKKSTVAIEWSLAGNATTTYSGGFVCHKDGEGLYILSTCHQLKPYIDNDDVTTLSSKTFKIKVYFFDASRYYYGTLPTFWMSGDLTLIRVRLSPLQLSTLPLPLIQPALLSKDPLYPRQAVYAIHHPNMTKLFDEDDEQLYFQETTGHIVELEYPVLNQPTRVHYSMSLVMSGSSGAPIFDKNTNKVLGIVSGMVPGETHNGLTFTLRRYAISVETIKRFLQNSDIPALYDL